ncbi:MAG TPA: hypothetical protein VGP68_17355 [Gemmataceae bacterium]|jgi:hypothetical protein|nr:hypothetical protein [Gemmataceae bacterium]
MNPPIIRAFVLCTEITDTPGSSGQKDVRGAGLRIIRSAGPYPSKYKFCVYLEILDRSPNGRIQLALMRADSGRRLFFWDLQVEFTDSLLSNNLGIMVNNCTFPAAGIYFLELWYDGKWQVDQRLEVV